MYFFPDRPNFLSLCVLSLRGKVSQISNFRRIDRYRPVINTRPRWQSSSLVSSDLPTNSSDDALQIHPVEGEPQLAKKKCSAGWLVEIMHANYNPRVKQLMTMTTLEVCSGNVSGPYEQNGNRFEQLNNTKNIVQKITKKNLAAN